MQAEADWTHSHRKGRAGGQGSLIQTRLKTIRTDRRRRNRSFSCTQNVRTYYEQFGAEHVRDTITNVELDGDIKVLTGEKDTYQAKNIIIATGAYARPIGQR